MEKEKNRSLDEKTNDKRKKEEQDRELDEELKGTFPASDPGQHNGHA